VTGGRDLFERWHGNPVLTAADWPDGATAVFNPAAVRFAGETLLLVRVEERTGRSHLGVARSADGLTGWTVEPGRALRPDTASGAERFGIEDPRITRIGDDYLVVYTGYSSRGPLVALASTPDFERYERRGVLLPPENKDAALFPERIGGRYALIHRPVVSSEWSHADMWLSFSPDLRHWGDHALLLESGPAGAWDSSKVGLGPPPLATPRGWLLLYHGVRTTAAGSIYRLGLALLDRDRPEHVLARSDGWVFGPEAPYERAGDVGNVVFPCGWVLLDDGDTIRVYYGAADTTVCVATASLAALLEHL
jgi:beta-1,4-mannooligosaccharide/beta-1,4-mannosyl-N-acetylglucosamine phosphorylase